MIKDQILQTATRCFVRYGIKRVKMDSIAQQLRISKKTIYDYFKGKDELLLVCLRNLVDCDRAELRKLIAEEPSVISAIVQINSQVLERMLAFCPTFIRDLHEHSQELTKIADEYRDFVRQEYVGLLRKGIDEGLFIPQTDCLLVPKLFDAQMKLILSESMVPNEQRIELYNLTIFALLSGFCTEYGRRELTVYSFN